MPRRVRHALGGYVYHVLNRAVGRDALFAKATDYEAFVRVLSEALDWVDIRLLGYCVMPNHWHLVVWPERDGDLSEFMRWLTVTHTQRWHAKHHTQGTGPLYQGRFKAFPVADDDHYLRVLRYVERNPLRAGLVPSASRWRWSSLGRATLALPGPPLETGPVAKPEHWQEWVDQPETEAELTALRRSVARGMPFGAEVWQRQTAKRLGLEASLRPVGRPRKSDKTSKKQ
jgi:putative transposase